MLHVLAQSAVHDWLYGLGLPLLFALIIVSAAFAAFTIERILIAVLRQWTKRSKPHFDDLIVNAAHPGAMVAMFVGLVWFALRYLELGFSAFTTDVVNNVGRSLIIVAIGFGIVRLVAGILRIPARRNPRWFPLSTVGVRIAASALWVIILLVIMNQYGVEITPVLATLGVASLAVGLALEPTLRNFFAGLWIQSGQNLRPGHFVRIESEKLDGFIEEVGWRTTRIRTLPGNMIIVPNHELSQAIITNFSLPAEKMGTSITFVCGFEVDPDHVVRVALAEVGAAAKEIDYVLVDPAPACRLNGRVDHGWEFWCGFWVAHYWDQWNAQGQVYRRLRARFLQEGIRLALPIHEEFMVPPERKDVRDSIISVGRVNGGRPSAAAYSSTNPDPGMHHEAD